jgi:hypothetical protein
MPAATLSGTRKLLFTSVCSGSSLLLVIAAADTSPAGAAPFVAVFGAAPLTAVGLLAAGAAAASGVCSRWRLCADLGRVP